MNNEFKELQDLVWDDSYIETDLYVIYTCNECRLHEQNNNIDLNGVRPSEPCEIKCEEDVIAPTICPFSEGDYVGVKPNWVFSRYII